MCETILILAVTTFATAQIFHNRDFNNFPHPRSFASNFDGNRRFGENQFGLERRDVRYRNDGNWNADRDHSFERDYPYRPEFDIQYDNSYNNRFNPNFQQNSDVGQTDQGLLSRNNNFRPENFDGETFNSRNSENEYHSNIENKYRNHNINLNSKFGAEGQDYNHQQTEFKSVTQKQRRERNNEFFNENSRSDFYNQNTAFKRYSRKESGDERNFDSENIDSLTKISNRNGELNKNTRSAKSRVADKTPSAEHNETINNTTLNDNAKVINETSVPENVTNQILNIERKETGNDTTNDNKDSERNKKTDDMWVWDIEDKANITTATTTTSTSLVTPDVNDRAAFDGGQCASGKIKVGNECVDVD